VTTGEVERLRASVRTLQAQNATFRQLVAIHDRLGGLVLQGADVAAISEVLADLIGRHVLLLDTQLLPVAMGGRNSDPWTPAQPYVSRVLEALAGERRPLRVPAMPDWGVQAACVLAPIAVGDAILGYLGILEKHAPSPVESNTGENVDLQIVQHAAAVYALSMMRERMASEVAQQLKDELLEGLLLGRAQDEQVAQERAMRLGYDPSRVYKALVLVVEPAGQERPGVYNGRRRRVLDDLATFCIQRAPHAILAAREDELVVLVPEQDGAELAQLIRQDALALLPGWQLTIGIGGACASAHAIARSYQQARRAVSTAVRFGRRGDVVAFEELGLYRLLFHVSDPAELRGFVDQVLGRLVEYDRRHRASLVRTLAVYLAQNGNLQQSARELDLHVNSVSYRLQRIQTIAGLSLDRAEDRLLAQVALKILDAGH
jgi:purine catabolism regulator